MSGIEPEFRPIASIIAHSINNSANTPKMPAKISRTTNILLLLLMYCFTSSSVFLYFTSAEMVYASYLYNNGLDEKKNTIGAYAMGISIM